MILFLSDFGLAGPYVGQVHAILARLAPGIPVIDLMHDLPAFRPAAAGCLIRAILESMDRPGGGSQRRGSDTGDIVLAVVDPGVGTARDPIIVDVDGMRFVGPDNGLFSAVLGQDTAQSWRIDWRPVRISDSFHGRDLFAPVAAMLARGQPVACTPRETGDLVQAMEAGPLAEVIYCDRFGNAMTGIEAADLGKDAVIEAAGRRFLRARTFADLPPGIGFWYANSLGLAEIAVNQGSAASLFGLTLGLPVHITK